MKMPPQIPLKPELLVAQVALVYDELALEPLVHGTLVPPQGLLTPKLLVAHVAVVLNYWIHTAANWRLSLLSFQTAAARTATLKHGDQHLASTCCARTTSQRSRCTNCTNKSTRAVPRIHCHTSHTKAFVFMHVQYVQYNIIRCTSILVETDTVPCDAISWSHNTRKSHSAQTYPAFSQQARRSILAIAAPPALQVTDPSEVSL